MTALASSQKEGYVGAWLVVVAVVAIAMTAGGSLLTPATIALVVGIIIGNSPLKSRFEFAAVSTALTKRVLRLAIVALGAGMNLELLRGIGVGAIAAAAVGVIIALTLTRVLATILRTSWRAAILVGVGTAICGASAIVATAPIVGASEEEVGIALGVIFTFNAFALVALPAAAVAMGLGDTAAGMWIGLGVHDTASAVAAGFALGPNAGEIATLVKLARTLLLVPLLLIVPALGRWGDKSSVTRGGRKRIRNAVPGFVVAFALAAALNTAGLFGSVGAEVAALGRIAIVAVVAGVGLSLVRGRLGTESRSLARIGVAVSASISLVALAAATLFTSSLF